MKPDTNTEMLTSRHEATKHDKIPPSTLEYSSASSALLKISEQSQCTKRPRLQQSAVNCPPVKFNTFPQIKILARAGGNRKLDY